MWLVRRVVLSLVDGSLFLALVEGKCSSWSVGMCISLLIRDRLGHFGVQYAKAMGMRVIAIDGGDAKRELCMKLGAEAFIDFTHCD